jgi:nucleoside-diphosphate-sugar epimerase
VRAIHEVVGGPPEPVVLGTAQGEIQEQYLDSTKARTMLGWSSRRTMRETLPPIAEWYRRLLVDREGPR